MEQLSLNYEEIKKVANRDYLRNNKEKFKISGKVAYWIALKDISVRGGFNDREDYHDVPGLADSIFEHGLNTPFDLDILPDGRNFIYRGHRRYKALQLLLEQKRIDENYQVLFFPTSLDETELNRKADQIISNNFQKSFNPLEMAKVVWNLKNNFSAKPKPNEEIAKLLALSRQTIDNLIIIHEAPAEIRNEIKVGNMSMHKALDFIRNQRRIEKQLDQKEIEAGQTSMYISQSKDELAGELKELEDLENTPDPEEISEEEAEQLAMQRKVQDEAREAKELEHLLSISDEVKVSQETLMQHFDKKLSYDVFKVWDEDFIDEDSGEVVNIVKKNRIVTKNTVLTEEVAKVIVEAGVETILLYRKGCEPIAPSVITEPVAEKEKDKYDNSRPEIVQVQNVIKLLDKLDMITQKFDIPDGSKKDVADIVKWCQKDLDELRTWVHKNKKQNKER
jgi:ParB-like chromosome segregation protein Spo0J